MEYSAIEAIAGPEIARKLHDDSYFNEHIAGQEQDIDAQELDDLTRGAAVLGIDPVNYPLTDGLYIYLKPSAGPVIALLIEVEVRPEQFGGMYEVLRISRAAIEPDPTESNGQEPLTI